MLLAAPSASAAPQAKPGRAMVSFYWVIDENAPRYKGAADAVLRDAHGHVIAHTSRRFRKALVLEGSGWLRDGRTVTYDCKKDGEHRFRVTKARCGYTVNGCALVPYRTAAVDPHFIKLGSTIFIPKLKGAPLPDGTIHDGVFVATDRGHFRGRHIDLFVGEGAGGAQPFIRRGCRSRTYVVVNVLKSGGAACARQ